MKIININEVDLRELEKLFFNYSKEIEEPMSIKEIEGYLNNIKIKLNEIKTLFFKVAIINDQIVGFIFFNTKYKYLNKDAAFILELYVEPSFRYNGIGKKLINCVEEAIEKEDTKIIYLTSDAKSKLFYQKCEFVNANIIDVDNKREIYYKEI